MSVSGPAPTRVQQMLLHCCSRPGAATRPALRRLLRGFGEWESLVAAAEGRHRITPMVHRHLVEGCEDLVPASVLEGLAASCRNHVTRALQMTGTLVRLAAALDRAGARWISYKGPILARVLYGDLGLRHSIDLDLLLPDDRFDGLEEILLSHGLEPGAGVGQDDDLLSSLHFYNPEDGLQVDVHWHLFRPYYGMRFDFDRLWDRIRPVKLGGQLINALHPHDRIIVLGAHGTKHLWQQFKWLCDFRLAVDGCPEEEWEDVLERSRELQAESLFFPAVWTLHSLLDTPVPGPLKEALARCPRAAVTGRRLAHSALSGTRTGSWSSALLKLRLIPTRQLRIRYLADGVRRRVLGSSG